MLEQKRYDYGLTDLAWLTSPHVQLLKPGERGSWQKVVSAKVSQLKLKPLYKINVHKGIRYRSNAVALAQANFFCGLCYLPGIVKASEIDEPNQRSQL